MPSYLDFDSTKNFRDYVLSRTLNQPNGPQSFNSTNYSVQGLSDFTNVDLGTVIDDRTTQLLIPTTSNIFKPAIYIITDSINTLPRRANLQLYPYFTANNNTLISLFNQNGLQFESELVKFSSRYLSSPSGPVFSRISQNLNAAATGRVRLLDALAGNTTTAINIVTGREPLIEKNNKITVAKTLPGKAIDFIQTVAGVEFPFTEIPGDYLTDPRNPINYRPEARTELGNTIQDVTGALGSLIGIQRRPKTTRKPSDLMIEYLGSGQKSSLFDNLSYSKYAPNYTTTARSQNSSKIFNFIDNAAQGVKNFLGIEAPRGVAYIGDDRGDDVKFAMNDFNDRQVRGNYYLSLMFDPVQAELFQRKLNISEGGEISGKLTWISKNSRNKLGTHNEEWGNEQSQYTNTLSTNFDFREDSILGYTQELLDSLPRDGASSRSHVANVIDQTSRFFREGDMMISRGSAVKYVNNVTGEQNGTEFCRVWTKDRSYMNYSDTMKRTGNVRKYSESVMTTPWNLNIGPMSNGKKGPESFDQSTNIKKLNDGFVAKKYMFSIENLAWASSTEDGFKYTDLPICERGPNGGRVMWFPPYDLKVSEQNNAKWDENNFLGRPEPIYTYNNTTRSGQISFKVVVDHPSILNLLVREHFEGMSPSEADDYINSFFAGCEEIDFYSLIRRYTTLTPDDLKLITDFLDKKTDKETIKKFRVESDPIPDSKPEPQSIAGTKLDVSLLFQNDTPQNTGKIESGVSYENLFNQSIGISTNSYQEKSIKELETTLSTLLPLAYSGTSAEAIKAKQDITVLYSKNNPDPDGDGNWTSKIKLQTDALLREFEIGRKNINTYKTAINQLKEDIISGKVQEVVIKINSSCSAAADDDYNYKLSARRSHSIVTDIFKKLTNIDNFSFNWSLPNGSPTTPTTSKPIEKTFKELGFDGKEGKIIIISTNNGEKASINDYGRICSDANFNNKLLRINAPIAFACRQSQIKMEYTKAAIPQEIPNVIIPTTRLVEETTTNQRNRRPSIDVLKRIIMKTLSECYYFKTLEENDPVVFTSLKEKLKYFHPGFHSTTPEGLNSRLTFIQQCVRPGNSIPIKGISETLDTNARNTTFGPPPICVLRIGDFYNSKIIIRDVNITFDDTTWDLNPEGIGVQPMIANVSLTVNFIGGQGISKPVERLQNALSSNFYANTEMYDERSISTADESINGQTREEFTKEFLEDIQYNPIEVLNTNNTTDGGTLTNGNYLGKIVEGNTLSYTELIDEVFKVSNNYVTSFEPLYNELNKKYGPSVLNLLVGSTYRSIKDYDVFTQSGDSPGLTLNLIGLYNQNRPLSKMVEQFLGRTKNTVDDVDLCEVLGFNTILPKTKIQKTNDLLRPHIKTLVTNRINSITEDDKLKSLEDVRNKLTQTLDKVNYLVKNQKDVIIKDDKVQEVTLSGYTYDKIYNEYSSCIEYLNKNSTLLTEGIDTTINFNNPTVDVTTLKKLLSSWLSSDEEKNALLKLFENDTIIFDNNTVTNLKNRLNQFVVTPTDKKFKFKKFKERKSNKKITFNIETTVESTNDSLIEESKKLFSKTVSPVGTKLNYYKTA